MNASVVYVPGRGFLGHSDSGHATAIDWSKEGGGSGGASSPVEMVLLALGACSAIDVVTILGKARTPVGSLRVELAAERRDEHPRVFTKIHVEYIVKGDGIKPAALERAIKLSEEKYCSVAGMIRGVAQITSSFRLEA